MREILVVRHGEAYNTMEPDGQREIVDSSNPPLTPYGEKQAEATAEVVKLFDPQIVSISPFVRVAQTALASLVGNEVPAGCDIRLSEHFIFSNMKTFDGIDPEYYSTLFNDRLQLPVELQERSNYPAFGEPSESVFKRVNLFLKEWLDRSDWDRISVFGHGATVGGILKSLVPEQAASMPPPLHCAVTRLVSEDGNTWSVREFMDVSHLDAYPPR